MKYIILLLLVLIGTGVQAQKLDSLFFNLYTDSLKKGTYNYINVDGKFSDGRYLPLTEKELLFSASAGKFKGNSLFVDSSITDEKITVTAVLKADSSVKKNVTIYIKTYEPDEPLKTIEDIFPDSKRPKNRRGLNKEGSIAVPERLQSNPVHLF